MDKCKTKRKDQTDISENMIEKLQNTSREKFIVINSNGETKRMHAHNAGTWIQLLLPAHVSTVDRSLSNHNTVPLRLLTCSERALLRWTANSD